LGEAHVILGNLPEAQRWYQQALSRGASRLGDVASIRRNLMLLAKKLPVSPEIWELFNSGSVVVFSGHMIDHPERPDPRFPADPQLEERVRASLDASLDRMRAVIGYVSGACGGDILFAEALLARQGELHVVFP